MVALMALTRSLMERRPMPGVDEVNGERGEFDEYDVCSEWQKRQKVKSDFT